MKILYITDSDGMGGSEGYLLRLLQAAVCQPTWQVGLLLPERPSTAPLVAAARQLGVEVHFFDYIHRHGLSMAAVLAAYACLRRLRPDVVHFVLPAPRRSAEVVIAATFASIPRRVATFQLVTPVPQFGRVMGWLRRLNRQLQFAGLTHAITVSQGNRQLLIEQYAVPAQRLQLIANAVDTSVFTPAGTPEVGLRQQWGVAQASHVIGVVGRLTHSKGQDVILAAMPAVWQEFPDCCVVLVGTGELEPSLRQQAAQPAYAGRVVLTGQLNTMPAAYRAFDLMVLPSRYEGLPFAVLEAMASGLPVIASQVDGSSDLITHGVNGWLVPPADPQALAQRLRSVLADHQQRQQVGQAARMTVERDYSLETMIHATFRCYQ